MERKTKSIKHYELFNIQRGLEGLNGVSGVQLGMYRGRLTREVNDHIDNMKAYMKTEEWLRVDKLVEGINSKYATKDNGVPVVQNNKYVFTPENDKERLKELDELAEQEKEAIAERERLHKEFNRLLSTMTPFEVTTIPYSVIKEVEDVYIKLGKESPFKSEIIDLLTSIIDMET